MNINILILLLLIIYNIITFFVYGYDKYCAKRKKWRVPEKLLILIAFWFGGIGAFLGMQLFRHKTKHIKFKLLIPVFLVVQIIILCIYIKTVIY